MNEGYERLFAAIYKQAVAEDTLAVCIEIQHRLSHKGISQRETLNYISENKEEIRKMVAQCIYEESHEWGNRKTRKMQKQSIESIVNKMIDNY